MDIRAEKLHLMRMLLETEDISILKKIKTIFESPSKGDIWYEWNETVTKDVEEAITQADSGKLISHEKAITLLKKW